MTGLPSGLTLSSNGIISGNVQTGANFSPRSVNNTFTFTVLVRQGNCTISQDFSIDVKCNKANSYIGITALPNGVVGQPYYYQLTENQFPCCKEYYSSIIAPGLTLDIQTGVISGIPTTSQPATPIMNFVFPCTHVCEYETYFVLTIDDRNCPVERIYPAGLPNGSIGITYGTLGKQSGIQFTTSLQGILTWNMYGLGEFEVNTVPRGFIMSGNPSGLPYGLVFNKTTGVLFGTPIAGAKSRQYLVTVTNGICSTQMLYEFTVPCEEQLNSPPIVLPDATVGLSYYFGITPSISSFTGRQIQGSLSPNSTLPNGFYLTSNRQLFTTFASEIAGMPINANSSVFFSVDYTDGECTYTRKYVFTINPSFTTPNTPIEVAEKLNSKAEKNQNLIKVYPNPSKSDFNVYFGNLDISKANIRVYDMQGRNVYSSKLKKNETTISLTNQPSGIYILEVEGTKEHILKYLIKE